MPATEDLLDFGSRPWLLSGSPDRIHPLYRECVLCICNPPGLSTSWHIREEHKPRQGERNRDYSIDYKKPLPASKASFAAQIRILGNFMLVHEYLKCYFCRNSVPYSPPQCLYLVQWAGGAKQ